MVAQAQDWKAAAALAEKVRAAVLWGLYAWPLGLCVERNVPQTQDALESVTPVLIWQTVSLGDTVPISHCGPTLP